VAAISYDAPAVLRAFAQQRGITFPLLSDAESATIRSFGLLNPAVEWGLGPDRDDPAIATEVRRLVSAAGRASEMMRGMALPGTLMLDRRGRVTARFFEDFYVDRNTVASVLVRAGSGDKPVSATRISSEQVELTAFVSDAEVAPGNRVSIVLDVVPKKGMHVYAPGAAGYKVIGLTLDAQPFVKPLPMIHPPSEIYHFQPLNERVPVFQKAVRLTQDVLIEGTAPAQAAWREKTTVTLAGRVEYQACDDKVCYSPVSAPVSFAVALKRLITERIKQ